MPDRDVDVRRTAVTALGAALRAAAVAAVVSEVPVDGLERATELARALTEQLLERTRGIAELASVDDPPNGFRLFGPVIGAGSAVAPPLELVHAADGIEARVTLDRRFEGPAGIAHGGVAALLLDELLGQAEIDEGRWGMTASLTIGYKRPLPLGEELLLRARVTGTEGRKTWIGGTIATAEHPDAVCVTAEGLFIIPRDSTYERYFGGVTSTNGAAVDVRFGRAAEA